MCVHVHDHVQCIQCVCTFFTHGTYMYMFTLLHVHVCVHAAYNPPSLLLCNMYVPLSPFPFSLGQTPLHLAAGCGSTDVMKQLVKVKADVNVQDSKSGKTALHHSIEKGDLPMTGYLVMEVCTCTCTLYNSVVYTHFMYSVHVHYLQCTCTLFTMYMYMYMYILYIPTFATCQSQIFTSFYTPLVQITIKWGDF